MKKLIILSFLFVCITLFSQNNNTIVFKSGEVLEVYQIRGIEKGKLWYFPKKDYSINGIDTTEIKSYSIGTIDSKENSLVVTKYNNGNLINKDTLYTVNNHIKENSTEWIKLNLRKYYKENRASQLFYGAGIVSTVIYGINPIKNTAFSYLGAGLGLVGTILYIDSFKFIKRASIEYRFQEIKVKIKL